MSGSGRLPPSPPTPGLGSGAGPPISPSEEANPFSFKEFVRSKNQSTATAAPTAMGAPKGATKVALEPRRGNSVSPKEPPRFPLTLDDDNSLSLESLGPNLGFQEPFFPDLTVVSSVLEDEDEDDDDWSSSYQPSAVEEVHSARAPSTSLSSTDSFYSDPSDRSDLQVFSPWQLGGSNSLLRSPFERGDHSLPVNSVTVRDGFCPPLQQSYEELKQENAKLRSKINHLQAVSETQMLRVKQLERTLEESKQKEARDAQDLEAMVQQVEENLQLMTKRAVKAESGALKLKQENAVLQVQLENYRLENEALRSRHLTELAVVKQNADVALQNLLGVVAKSQSSIKQLISGAEALQLVAELLKSIDKISEISPDSS